MIYIHGFCTLNGLTGLVNTNSPCPFDTMKNNELQAAVNLCAAQVKKIRKLEARVRILEKKLERCQKQKAEACED